MGDQSLTCGTKPRLLPAGLSPSERERLKEKLKQEGWWGQGRRSVSCSPLAKNSKKIFALSFWESEVRSQLPWVKGRCQQAEAFEALGGNPSLPPAPQAASIP